MSLKSKIDILSIKVVPDIKNDFKEIDPEIFLKKNVKCSVPYTKLIIKKLWGNKYRMNFFGEKVVTLDRGSDHFIVYSVFVILDKDENGYKISSTNTD